MQGCELAAAQRATHRFWRWVAIGAAVTLAGLLAAHHMESNGHAVTGMHNQVVWGTPHVFAILLIVAASGVLNVASIGSVFGQSDYKRRAPLAGVLCLALLAGGLAVLTLDLGRPERIVVAATRYNLSSMFAWNVILYSGLAALVLLYLWTLFERRRQSWSAPVGLAVLGWRFVLTSGTGSIFGFLVARQAYQSALLAPLFIVLSFAWGLAVFVLAQAVLLRAGGATMPDAVERRLARLLGIFTLAALYFVAVLHLTNLYWARQAAFEAFVLLGRQGGESYAALFWAGYVGLGSVLPAALLLHRPWASRRNTLLAAGLVLAGALAWLAVFIIGGQAYPLDIFPGRLASSSFGDGQVARYSPSLPELLLGLGGVGISLVLALAGARAFDLLPHDEAAEVHA